MKKGKGSKRRKHEIRKKDKRQNIIDFVLSAVVLLALFILNGFNRSMFLNDGYFYLIYIAVFLISGAYFFLTPGKVGQLSFRKRFLAAVGICIVAWGALVACNIYYSKENPLKHETVKLDDISVNTKKGITLYFTVDGTSNSYSGTVLKKLSINHENRQYYVKRLRLKLAYRKGILGSYVLSNPMQIVK
ncbi:hypothetical protein [uncultured Flavobacterium sp.]|uniref:hypothetical protein n=1 Tax=uncultured Flavobacterium sp. TaxID=165435 RepID=UPI0025FF73F5|nr:hypothetical protein [uncultured Flavobacterium sp.]